MRSLLKLRVLLSLLSTAGVIGLYAGLFNADRIWSRSHSEKIFKRARNFSYPTKAYTWNTKPDRQSLFGSQDSQGGVKSRSLFEMYGLNNVEILRPLEVPRPSFEFLMTPDITENVAEYISANDIRHTMVTTIKSDYRRHQERQAIRDSWGAIRALNGMRIHVVFVIAFPNTKEEESSLKAESAEFGDLLQVSMNETYRGIGLKALAAMQWAGSHFRGDWLYFSADDDILPDFQVLFSNIDALINESKKMGSFEMSFPMYCVFGYDASPEVLRSGKWAVSESEYPHKRYPDICLGGFYGMTVKLAKAIYNASRHYPYFRHDDVFITGFMRLAVCDSYLEGEFSFDNDKLCAISTIRNSNFQHLKVSPHVYKNLWMKREAAMLSNGAKIIKHNFE